MNHPLTAKLMNEKLKQGWTTTEFVAYLEISEDQFFDLLKKNFTRNAYEGFRNSLKKNEKYQKRITKNATSDAHPLETPVDHPIEIPVDQSLDTSVDQSLETPTEETTSVENNANSDINTAPKQENLSIEELEEKRQQSLNNLSDLEIQHKDMVSERTKIRSEISNHQEAFKKMLEEVSKRQQSILALQERFTSIGETMEEITSKIRDTKLVIAQYTTQIEQARTIYIYACDSGEVVNLDTNQPFEVSEWKPMLVDIVTDDELESLTVKQLNALAKAITLVRSLIAQKIPYEVGFDSKIADAYFRKVIS